MHFTNHNHRFPRHLSTGQILHRRRRVSFPLVHRLFRILRQGFQIRLQHTNDFWPCHQFTVRATKIHNEIYHVTAVMKRFCRFHFTQCKAVLDAPNATGPVPTGVEMFDHRQDSFLQCFGVIKRHATPHHVNVRRWTWYWFVSVVVRCQCFVAHAGVAFDGTAFVVALERGHQVFDGGLEPVVHSKCRQSNGVQVFGFPDEGFHVHGRRGHQPDQGVVLAEVYFLVWVLRLLFLQCWVNRGHELAQLLQVLLGDVQFLEGFTDAQQCLLARGLQWVEDLHAIHVGCETMFGEQFLGPCLDLVTGMGQGQGQLKPSQDLFFFFFVVQSRHNIPSVFNHNQDRIRRLLVLGQCSRFGGRLDCPFFFFLFRCYCRHCCMCIDNIFLLCWRNSQKSIDFRLRFSIRQGRFDCGIRCDGRHRFHRCSGPHDTVFSLFFVLCSLFFVLCSLCRARLCSIVIPPRKLETAKSL